MSKKFRECFYENTEVTKKDLVSEDKLKEHVESCMIGITR